jgi:hypothetical protein
MTFFSAHSTFFSDRTNRISTHGTFSHIVQIIYQHTIPFSQTVQIAKYICRTGPVDLEEASY